MGQHFIDAVLAILRREHVPLVELGQARSGLALSGNGRLLRIVTIEADGGAKKLALLTAWFLVAVETLRLDGFPVAVSRDNVTATIGSPAVQKGAA
jgi:hypothetical protein